MSKFIKILHMQIYLNNKIIILKYNFENTKKKIFKNWNQISKFITRSNILI